MNLLMGRRSHKLIVAVIVLILVQLSCSNVSSTDPNIPITLNNMAGLFNPLLSGLGVIPIVTGQPPLITQIQADSISGLGSVGIPIAKIHLYPMQLQGCANAPIRGELLAETTINTDGTWTITYNLNPGEVIGATQVSNNKESGLSNLKVYIEPSQFLLLDNANNIQGNSFESFQPMTLTGISLPKACVILQNQDPQYGRVGSASADANGRWSIQMPIQDGENKMKLFVDGWEEIGVEFSITGFTPVMQWPYQEKDKDGNYIAPITAWFGENDYHMKVVGIPHDGIDIGGKEGTPVHSVADGRVIYIQIDTTNELWGGNALIIDHGAWFSVYMHLGKIDINNFTNPPMNIFIDQPIMVKSGDKIGETGNTGRSNLGSLPFHLHFSAFLWKNGDMKKSFGNILPTTWKWPWDKGIPINVNPHNSMLGNNQSSTVLLQKCESDFDYWEVDWRKIPIKNYSDPSGTLFNTYGKDPSCVKIPY